MYGRYSTAVVDKRDSFTFNIVNFPHLSSNIPSKPAYGVYISQLVRIGRICSNFVQFKLTHYTLTQKLMKQGFWYSGLCMAFRRFARSHVGIIPSPKPYRLCLPASAWQLGVFRSETRSNVKITRVSCDDSVVSRDTSYARVY